jgi:hypothetical protein
MTQSSQGFLFVPDVAAWSPPAGLVIPISKSIRRKWGLFGALRHHFRFPAHFGWNWDALNDCLHDLSWLDPQIRHISVVHDGVPFTADSTILREAYLSLLHGLVTENHPENPRWTVVFPVADRAIVDACSSR